MLARRFTIVCLLSMLFGLFFAHIVAEASRQPRTFDRHGVTACVGCDPAPRWLAN